MSHIETWFHCVLLLFTRALHKQTYITAVKKENQTNTKPLASSSSSSSVPFKDPTDRAGCYYVSVTCLLPLFDVAGGERRRDEMKTSVV